MFIVRFTFSKAKPWAETHWGIMNMDWEYGVLYSRILEQPEDIRMTLEGGS